MSQTKRKSAIANPALAKIEKNVVHPLADGQTEIKFDFGGKSASAKVAVKSAKADRPISFKLDVMPVFMRPGCNTGSCHGAARGKDGFRLSLFGYDPDGDHFRLTREISGRRINLAVPRREPVHRKGARATCRTPAEALQAPATNITTRLMRWIEAGGAA